MPAPQSFSSRLLVALPLVGLPLGMVGGATAALYAGSDAEAALMVVSFIALAIVASLALAWAGSRRRLAVRAPEPVGGPSPVAEPTPPIAEPALALVSAASA
jgi:hypothetical protein